MEKMITKEQYELMLPYEKHFWTAINGDYARNVTMEGFNILDEIYKDVYKRDSGLKSGCSRCRLRGLKDLGKLFYEYKSFLESEEAKTEAIDIIDFQTAEEFENKTEVIENKVVKKKKVTDKKNGGGK